MQTPTSVIELELLQHLATAPNLQLFEMYWAVLHQYQKLQHQGPVPMQRPQQPIPPMRTSSDWSGQPQAPEQQSGPFPIGEERMPWEDQ